MICHSKLCHRPRTSIQETLTGLTSPSLVHQLNGLSRPYIYPHIYTTQNSHGYQTTKETTKETASMRSRAGYDPSPKHVFTSNPGILYTWLALLASSTLLERVTRVTHDTQLLSSFSAPSPRMTSYFTSDHPQYTHITFHAPCSQSDGFQ